MVTVFQDNVKRNKWKLGEVESLIRGKDDIMMGAKIQLVTNSKPVQARAKIVST